MDQDEVEIHLTSNEPAKDFDYEVGLSITAYFRGGSVIDSNTLIFDCNPIGSNYSYSYLDVTFDNWSKIVEIRDFLAQCFSESDIVRRAKTVDVTDGMATVTHFERGAKEEENLDEITVEVNHNRVNFYQSGNPYPYIYTYEEKTDGEPQDRNNVDKLLNFFDEIIAIHPDFDPEDSESENPQIGSLFDQHHVADLIGEIVTSESDLFKDYQKAVREFENDEYEDCVRDLGRASEAILRRLCYDLYVEEDVSDRVGGQLSTLYNEEDGLPSFIGMTISPLWWLRNKASHSDPYTVSKEDAQYALLCFQTSTEKLIEEHLELTSD